MERPRHRLRGVAFFLACACLLFASSSSRAAEPFPTWPELEPRVAFWVDVYTRYTTRQAVIHDAERPHVVYGVVELGGEPLGGLGEPVAADGQIMRLARERVQGILASLQGFSGGLESLSDLERQVHDAVAGEPEPDRFLAAVDRVRVQRGQADRFRLGLIRSGRYVDAFREIARQEGVPEDLAYLPHVESSFDASARSHVGAAGLWQFMRATARRFMTIDSSRDERLDPWIASRAAFRFLRENHEALGSWPLALTAYNHGPNGMARARREFGDDLVRIIAEYRSRTFGFASRNFYAEFLAARRIARDPERWFGPLEPEPPLRFDPVPLPEYVRADALARHLGVDVPRLALLNPALDARTWKGEKLLPRGYELRVPAGLGERLAGGWDAVPAAARYERAVDEAWHRVRAGETLSAIASRYGTSVSAIQALNGLGRSSLIRPGQLLKVREAETWVAMNARQGAGEGRHVVRRGDTLTAIGSRYGVAVAEIMRLNDLRDASRLVVGQVLLIPAGS